MREFIKTVVYNFYEKASSDILIGHQFRKIAMKMGSDPLTPPMESFKFHLPRIEEFWVTQLLGIPPMKPFDLINKHHYLMIRKGELDRWVVLLKEVIKEVAAERSDIENLDSYISTFYSKIDQFRNIFLKVLIA